MKEPISKEAKDDHNMYCNSMQDVFCYAMFKQHDSR